VIKYKVDFITKKLFKIVLFILVILIFFYLFINGKFFCSSLGKAKEQKYLSLFSEIATLVKNDYVETVNPKKKFTGAFSSMLAHLDKLSSYLDPEKTRIYKLYEKGILYSTGIYGIKLINYFYITDVVKNSPAEHAGLQAGDIVKSVKGKTIFSLSFWEMYFSLLTEKSENIDLVIFKKGISKPDKIGLKTKLINCDTQIKKIKNDVFYIELLKIDKLSVKLIKERLMNKKSLRLIIDLRKYSGGDFDSFIDITRLFFKKTTSVVIKTKEKEEKVLLGSVNPLKFKAVIIINQSTIMYSELLAALFKSMNAILIGSKTQGFISKLNHISLKDGSSVLITGGIFLLKGKDLRKSEVNPKIELKGKDWKHILDKSLFILEKY
jgi:carboxyl-terminal processing protease